jgi:hypothetical protein
MSGNPARTSTPTPQNGTVPPRPVPHAKRRPREYLTPKEVERLITAARQNRYGTRDATMIRVAYRHGVCQDHYQPPSAIGSLYPTPYYVSFHFAPFRPNGLPAGLSYSVSAQAWRSAIQVRLIPSRGQ